MSIQIHNPHSAFAVLQVRPEDVLEIVIPGHGTKDDAWARVGEVARQKKIPVFSAQKGGGSQKSQGIRGSDGRTSVAHARIREKQGVSAEQLFERAREKSGGHGVWLALDSLQDPHNVGAIFRTAAFFGVEGILLTEERSAPMSGTVYDVASGGVEHVPFTLQTNLQRAFEIAKDSGLWILGTSEHANDSIRSIDRDRPWLLVLGNEERGMRRLTEDSCDLLCKIPQQGGVTSLNVSVAAGILISNLLFSDAAFHDRV